MVDVAVLLPNGEQTFVDANGVPFAGGWVYFFVPNTDTEKDTWQDSGHSILNSNPVHLDSAGRAIIYGLGEYRQVLKDQFGNTIWDQLTANNLPAADVENFFALPVEWQDTPIAGELYPIVNIPFNLVLPTGLVGSFFSVDVSTLPAATAQFTLYKNGNIIGTVTFSVAGTPTVVFLSDVSWAPGDKFSITAPAVADAKMANVAMTFVFTAVG